MGVCRQFFFIAATDLTEGNTLPEGSADLEFLRQADTRGILPSERR